MAAYYNRDYAVLRFPSTYVIIFEILIKGDLSCCVPSY